jgi:hypothetical protein
MKIKKALSQLTYFNLTPSKNSNYMRVFQPLSTSSGTPSSCHLLSRRRKKEMEFVWRGAAESPKIAKSKGVRLKEIETQPFGHILFTIKVSLY